MTSTSGHGSSDINDITSSEGKTESLLIFPNILFLDARN